MSAEKVVFDSKGNYTIGMNPMDVVPKDRTTSKPAKRPKTPSIKSPTKKSAKKSTTKTPTKAKTKAIDLERLRNLAGGESSTSGMSLSGDSVVEGADPTSKSEAVESTSVVSTGNLTEMAESLLKENEDSRNQEIEDKSSMQKETEVETDADISTKPEEEISSTPEEDSKKELVKNSEVSEETKEKTEFSLKSLNSLEEVSQAEDKEPECRSDGISEFDLKHFAINGASSTSVLEAKEDKPESTKEETKAESLESEIKDSAISSTVQATIIAESAECFYKIVDATALLSLPFDGQSMSDIPLSLKDWLAKVMRSYVTNPGVVFVSPDYSGLKTFGIYYVKSLNNKRCLVLAKDNMITAIARIDGRLEFESMGHAMTIEDNLVCCGNRAVANSVITSYKTITL